MLLSIHSTLVVFPKPGILVSTPVSVATSHAAAATQSWDTGTPTRGVAGGPGHGVVLLRHVLLPAVHHEGEHLVDVEPEVEPVAGLAAPPVPRARPTAGNMTSTPPLINLYLLSLASI